MGHDFGKDVDRGQQPMRLGIMRGVLGGDMRRLLPAAGGGASCESPA